MLDPTHPLCVLDPTRKPEVIDGIEALSNQRMDEGVSGPIFNLIFLRDHMRNWLSGILGRGASQFHQKTFLLDAEYVNEIKASHDQAECEHALPFISSNDVVTSTCFNVAKPTFGFMAVNYRGKVENCERYDAPNYINVVTYGDTGKWTYDVSCIPYDLRDTSHKLHPQQNPSRLLNSPVYPQVDQWWNV